MSTRPSITVIGSINTDMLVVSEHLPKAGETILGSRFTMSGGGKGANQAIAAARLGAEVAMVGCVGEDLFGQRAQAALAAESIDCRNVCSTADASSGVALICVDEQGENQIVVAPGANNRVSEQQIAAALNAATANTLVLLQLEIPLAAVAFAVDLAFAKGARIILDPAPAQTLSPDLLGKIHLLTPNQTEAELLTGIEVVDVDSAHRAAAALLALGAQNVALTLGSDGLLLATSEASILVPATPVQAVDTTAAGDCFNGALASAVSRGASLEQATRFACRAAAVAVTRWGAQDSLPTLAEGSTFNR